MHGVNSPDPIGDILEALDIRLSRIREGDWSTVIVSGKVKIVASDNSVLAEMENQSWRSLQVAMLICHTHNVLPRLILLVRKLQSRCVALERTNQNLENEFDEYMSGGKEDD